MASDKTTRTVGIVADDYKLERFKKELRDGGFIEYVIVPFSLGVSTIKVTIPASRIMELSSLCRKVEFHFNRAN